MSEGIMSGVNCTRPVAELQGLRHGAHQQRLAEAGHAFDEHVAGRDQREHHFLDHARLPDDGLADAGAQLAEQVGGFLDGAGFSVPCFGLVDSKVGGARFRAPRWRCAARASCALRNNSSPARARSRARSAELRDARRRASSLDMLVVGGQAPDRRVAQRAHQPPRAARGRRRIAA